MRVYFEYSKILSYPTEESVPIEIEGIEDDYILDVSFFKVFYFKLSVKNCLIKKDGQACTLMFKKRPGIYVLLKEQKIYVDGIDFPSQELELVDDKTALRIIKKYNQYISPETHAFYSNKIKPSLLQCCIVSLFDFLSHLIP